MTELRIYCSADGVGVDGYPLAWHETIKDSIRERDGFRCLRCLHPYIKGEGEWSRCDDQCRHEGPVRGVFADGRVTPSWDKPGTLTDPDLSGVEAQWRILTVHHLNGVKTDCRWWNLASLCQRCHLVIQGKVRLDVVFIREHSEWFKPFAAGWYAWKYESRDITQAEALARLDELLGYEHRQDRLPARA